MSRFFGLSELEGDGAFSAASCPVESQLLQV